MPLSIVNSSSLLPMRPPSICGICPGSISEVQSQTWCGITGVTTCPTIEPSWAQLVKLRKTYSNPQCTTWATKRNQYKRIVTGALWGEQQLREINDTQSKCPHCGFATSDVLHTLWHCPVIRNRRQDRYLEGLDTSVIPERVLQGVPEATSAKVGGAYVVE